MSSQTENLQMGTGLADIRGVAASTLKFEDNAGP